MTYFSLREYYSHLQGVLRKNGSYSQREPQICIPGLGDCTVSPAAYSGTIGYLGLNTQNYTAPT